MAADSAGNKRNILLLDDDQHYLELFGKLMAAWSADAWQPHLARNSARAFTILTEQAIDLAVIDVNMPVVDGLQFLKLFNEKYPQIRKVVLTGYANEDKRRECLGLGADLFLEKPRSPEEYETIFAMFRELLETRIEKGFRGMLRRVGLEDIIQMECLARKSSVLEIANAQLSGRLFIENGSIVHAAAGELKGEAAFNTLLSLPGGEFKIRPFESPPEQSIQGQWEFLLMEAARLRDEQHAEAVAIRAAASPASLAEGLTQAAAEARAAALQSTGTLPTRKLEELVICSQQGAIHYQWHCANAEARAKLFTQLRSKSQMLTQLLRVGNLDRMEFSTDVERGVVLLAADRSVLARIAQNGAKKEGEPV